MPANTHSPFCLPTFGSCFCLCTTSPPKPKDVRFQFLSSGTQYGPSEYSLYLSTFKKHYISLGAIVYRDLPSGMSGPEVHSSPLNFSEVLANSPSTSPPNIYI